MAVDLSQFQDGPVGPRQFEAMMDELRMMAETRELALRAAARAEGLIGAYVAGLAATIAAFGEPLGDAYMLRVERSAVTEFEGRAIEVEVEADENGITMFARLRDDAS